jgi:hypothetical protein
MPGANDIARADDSGFAVAVIFVPCFNIGVDLDRA